MVESSRWGLLFRIYSLFDFEFFFISVFFDFTSFDFQCLWNLKSQLRAGEKNRVHIRPALGGCQDACSNQTQNPIPI
jgi:hypothetical protein